MQELVVYYKKREKGSDTLEVIEDWVVCSCYFIKSKGFDSSGKEETNAKI